MTFKVCFKCGESKSLVDFYPHAGMSDGRLNKCKTCAKAEAITTRKHATPEQRARLLAESRAWGLANREKRAAHSAVARAVRAGTLQKLPCFICGESRVEAHHVAYDLPLSVTWMCRTHHAKTHSEDFHVDE